MRKSHRVVTVWRVGIITRLSSFFLIQVKKQNERGEQGHVYRRPGMSHRAGAVMLELMAHVVPEARARAGKHPRDRRAVNIAPESGDRLTQLYKAVQGCTRECRAR